MNSKEIFDAIELIAGTSGKNDKQAQLRSFMEDPEFKRVCQYAYDPFKVFGVGGKSLVGMQEGRGSSPFTDTTWALLDALVARKLTGRAGQDVIASELMGLEPDSAALLRRVLMKDLRAGFSESSINTVAPGTVAEFPYMRCSLPAKSNMTKWDFAGGIIVQEKADGMFVNVNVYNDSSVWVTTRQGSPVTLENLPDLEFEIGSTFTPGTQSHGELTIARGGVTLPREEGNGILNRIVNGGELPIGDKIQLHVWDQIPLASAVKKGKYSVPYAQRLKAIFGQIEVTNQKQGRLTLVSVIETHVVRSMAELLRVYRKYLGQGKEGVVAKDIQAPWKDGTSKDQVKFKLEVTVDLVIKAIVPGKIGGKNEGRPGSLTCETSCGLLRTDVTVKNEAVRDAIEANPNNWISRVLAVTANAVLNSESTDVSALFLPRMAEAGYRIDKTVADSLQDVLDQFEAATK